MNNIDCIEKALEHFPQQRIISAWIEGDYAHGLAAKDNKPSLCVITMPQPWEILLGEARTTQNMRDLDIRILTPLSYIDGLLDGHRSLLESLTLPTECFLLDAGFIRAIEPFAHRLTTSNVVKTALDDARGNLSVLRHWPGMKSAKRNKSMAETARLLNGVRHIQSGTEAWPCLLDADEITLLRRIRLQGMNLADLERDYGLLADTRKTPPLPPLEPYVRRQVEDVVLGLNRRIVNREAESFSVKNLIHALHGFGDGITADAQSKRLAARGHASGDRGYGATCPANAPVESRRGQCDCRPLLAADSRLAEVRIPADGLRDVARRPLSFP